MAEYGMQHGYGPPAVGSQDYGPPGFGKGEEKPLLQPPPQQQMQPPAFQTHFASFSLHMYDRIRLLDFPPQVIPIIREAITSSWPRRIQDERIYAGSHEFKLHGNPWLGQGEEAMFARCLMLRVFESLWNAGWLMSLSTDVSKKQTDKDTLIFRYQTPPPPPCDWITISFSKQDRIRLMFAPIDLREAILTDIRAHVQESRPYPSSPNTWEIKLRGYPWYASGEETMLARRLLLRLMTILEQFGFTVYASIDQKATTQEKRSESDTWHCRRPCHWVPGAPLYHQ